MLDEFDIYSRVGRSTAHDEYIPFQIKNGRLVVQGRSSSYSRQLKITFQRLDHRDNPKINALIIWRGSIDRMSKHSVPLFLYINHIFDLEIPKLPAIPQMDVSDDDEPLDEDEEYNEPSASATAAKPSIKRNLKTSGPKVVDPYAEDQSSSFIPLLIALVAILPVLFCLCRL